MENAFQHALQIVEEMNVVMMDVVEAVEHADPVNIVNLEHV